MDQTGSKDGSSDPRI